MKISTFLSRLGDCESVRCLCEDDISDMSSSGGISAGGTGTSSSGAAASHAEQRAADEARVNTVVKEALLKNGVDGHVIANILGRLAAAQ